MKFCDLTCKYARFPDKLSDGSLSCRTFIGLYCGKLKKIVPKNGKCLADIEQKSKKFDEEL